MNWAADLSEWQVRGAVFFAVLIGCAVAEAVVPRRSLSQGRQPRWLTNMTLVALGAATVRILGALGTLLAAPLVAVAAALVAQQHGIGLLNLVAWPSWLEVLLAVLVLDFAIWLQHLAAHKIPMLWRFHRMHHADRDFDVTTALRFHPIEIGLSMLYKVVWVLAIGASPLAVVIFEIVLNACAMFNHGNIALPAPIDRALRLLIVTPDMHRVHHSVIHREHDSNYGFNLSIWDRLFSTYVPQPRDGHDAMRIGLPHYQDQGPEQLSWCLKLPFATGRAPQPRDNSDSRS